MWDTGSGISSAIFAVVATASEVQTALRTITGWEGVTVELWGSRKSGTSAAAHILKAHQFKVTFAAGYDDMGKTPTFYTMTPSDGAYAVATDVRAAIYDQRFSNSIWLGKTTGYFEVRAAADEATAAAKFTKVGSATIALNIQPQSGDSYYFSSAHFGAGASSGGSDEGTVSADGGTAGAATHGVNNDAATDTITATVPVQSDAVALRHAYLVSSATSRQTSDYFAVGSTVEVLASTWDDGATETPVNDYSNNLYRKFKVTGHVTNLFNTEFAKLDVFPSAEANSQPVVTGSGTANVVELEDLPDYNLKITSNNGTVRSYESTATTVTVNEVQVLVLATGVDGSQAICSDPSITSVGACTGNWDHDSDTDTADIARVAGAESTWKLSYKGEMSQDMDYKSTPAQVAEEINGFSALSGPVSVAGEGTTRSNGFPKYVITFDAADGDVAELGTHTDGTDVVTIVTRENGWSIEGPIGANLDTIQAGGTINITAREVCTFTVDANANDWLFYFCYDGVCGSTTVANVDPNTALLSIKDDNGDSILSLVNGDDGYSTTDNAYTVTMPMGKSCDGLEMRAKTLGSAVKIVKSVNKHNNGKVFKITRSFLQVEEAAPGTVTATTALTFGTKKGNTAVAGVSTVVFSDKSGQTCDAQKATDYTLPFNRVISGFTTAHGNVAAVATIGAVEDGNADNKCDYSLRRYVITLDSMPTASATTATKTLLYKSPVGSCNVAETTKGTFESYECSNRGACDGKSGLCACYEGYSGESCQTQTVLV